MITICKPIEAVAKLFEKTKIQEDIVYRLSSQCVIQNTSDGILLYQTLSCELLLLSFEEAEMLKRLSGSVPDCLKYLVSKRFLVPYDADEMKYCEQMRHIMALSAPKDDAITRYTIFTTTDCNARCFYCFELGRSRIPMSEETAQATVEYIASHCKGKPVHLAWFGGEPLFNAPVIDLIIAKLNEKGIPFSSTMMSNGYLFDEETVRKAKEYWNLKKIQITLDGTEKIYNRRKAYINNNGSAYQRVLHNIGLLLDAGIRTDIRLNLDMDNQEDLHKLVYELSERFGSNKKFLIYNHIIFETCEKSRSAEERRQLYRASSDLTEHIRRCGVDTKTSVPHYFQTNRCLADNDGCVTITPDGRLGKCDQFSETELWGSLRSEEKDVKLIESWKEKAPVLAECEACFYYPRCLRLKKCPTQRDYCDAEYKEIEKQKLQCRMLNSYEKWKAKAQIEEEPIDIEC